MQRVLLYSRTVNLALSTHSSISVYRGRWVLGRWGRSKGWGWGYFKKIKIAHALGKYSFATNELYIFGRFQIHDLRH